MSCVNNRRTPASSGFLLKIRHGCRTETLPDGRITVSIGFDYRLKVDAAVITLEHLLLEFGKFPISQNEEFVIRYYDSNSDNFCDVTTDDALTLMWGKHLGSRIVLMSIHIINKETGKETIVNDYESKSTEKTKRTVTEQLPLEYV